MKVTTAQREITPTGKFFPCYLCGHAIRTEIANGILTPLYVTALRWQIGQKQCLFVTVELILLEKDYTDELRQEFSRTYGIPVEQILIFFIHTHSAPECTKEPLSEDHAAIPGYMDLVKEQITAAVQGCFEKEPVEVELYGGTCQIDGLYCNRNGLEKPCDKSASFLKFVDQNGNVAAGMFNFTCHSTVLGPQNLKVSSDLAGWLAHALQERWKVYPLAVIGAAGDMSNRLYRQGNDEKELLRVCSEFMSQVDEKVHYEKLEIHDPSIMPYRFCKTYYPVKEEKQKAYDMVVDHIESAKNFDEKKVWTSALAMVKNGLECKPYTMDLECEYLDFGDLRAFVIPAELFSRFGLQIKEAMGSKMPLIFGYCNYSVNYLGNKEDYGASFETSFSDIPCGTTEIITSEVVEKIKEKNSK